MKIFLILFADIEISEWWDKVSSPNAFAVKLSLWRGAKYHIYVCIYVYIYIYIYTHIYIYIKWTVFVNVTTKSAQHAHARMIAIIVEKI